LKVDINVFINNVFIALFQTIIGSTTLFTALLKKCVDREVVPICKYVPSKNFPPRFVALLPQVMTRWPLLFYLFM